MAGFTNIEVRTEIRPCIWSNKKALFHRWIVISRIVPPSPMIGGHNGGEVKENAALIELEDGSIHRVKDTEIIFCDNKFNEYVFERNENE